MPFLFIGIIPHRCALSRLYELGWVGQCMPKSCKKALPAFPSPFWKDEIKEAQHRWRCTPHNILTQGSSLCSPTLGYQKRNPYGVLLSHEKLSFCAHSSFWNGYQKRKAMGFVSFTNPAKRLCLHPPSPWRGGGGEALMLRLYSKLGIFLWFSLLFHIFHQA